MGKMKMKMERHFEAAGVEPPVVGVEDQDVVAQPEVGAGEGVEFHGAIGEAN